MASRLTLLVDSNLLILLVIGLLDEKEISRFKRTQHFSVEDFQTLAELFLRARSVRTTPHILTEVSNLANSLPEWNREGFAQIFRKVIKELQEHWQSAEKLSQNPLFRYGIADVSALEASADCVVLTEDRRFAGQIRAAGGNVLDLKTAVYLSKELA